MDASRDIIESTKPPRPPRPSRSGDPSATIDRERLTRLLVGAVALSAVATAVFTGITAWETHHDRVNTEVIYCSIFSASGPENGTETATRTDAEQRMFDQLGC